jgi:two-component system, OmpR family, phosphate regulon response regulator PhoB
MHSILLVDDSPDTVAMYALGLAHAGYRPLTALDASSALDQLKQEHPDAVVTDLQLVGGRSGWDLIEQIKHDASTRQIPVIVLTGRQDPSIAVTAQRAGCAAVLIKPCLPDELAHVLDRVLVAVT